MIAKIFPTVNGVPVYKAPMATPIVWVSYCDSVYSVPSKGLRMDVYAFDQVPDWPSWNSGTVFTGNCPLVKFSAGYGSPIYVPDSYSNKPFFGFKYSGYFKVLHTGTATFLLWGNGFSKLKFKNSFVNVDGVEKVEISELNTGSISNDGKYVSVDVTGTAGHWEAFELYYLTKGRTNNPIGFCAHWSHASLPHPLVISAGFTSYADDGQPTDDTDPIASVTLQNIVSTNLSIKQGSSSEFRFTVPLVPPTASIGYKYVQSGDYLEDVNTGQQIKKFRMVEFSEGFIVAGATQLVQKFSGQIKDWVLDRSNNTAEIICFDWSSFLRDAINQGYPDPSDYWAAQYYKREPGGVAGDNKPRTFDAWGMTEAIECLCMNAYIDPIKFVGKKQFIDVDNNIVNGDYLIENLSLDSDLRISLERPYYYGNIGVEGGDIIPDDEYKWQVSIGETLIDQVEKISENFGYNWGFDRNGYLFIKPLNNPNTIKFWDDFNYNGDWSTATNLGAMRGAYKHISDSGSATVNNVYGSKFTLIIGVNNTCGTFHIKVENDVLGIVATQDYTGYNASERWYYNGIDSSTGLNPCKIDIATGLTYGSYDITITRDVDELRVNSLFVYDVDINSPVATLRTGGEPNNPGVITELSVESRTDEVRNDCLVVGKLLGIFSTLATDGTEIPVNPNNPESEHIISRTVDLDSIANPTSSHFVGRPIQSLIVDPKIVSKTRADWLSYEFIRRYRKAAEVKQPNYSMITNPLLEVGDCISIKDDATDILATSQEMWVEGFEDGKQGNAVISAVALNTTEPWVSYEVKPLPSLSMYGNKPITHVRVANRGVVGRLYISAYTNTTTIDVRGLHSQAIPTMGYVRLNQGTSKEEIIFYQGRYEQEGLWTRLANCLRGRQGTTATYHASNVMANLAMDPYLSEERGTTPVITFDTVVPGWVKAEIFSSANHIHVDTLTGMEESDWDKKWDRVEWGMEHTYAWGMLDMRGEWNRSIGNWKDNWNIAVEIPGKFYVREAFKNDDVCSQNEEDYAQFYVLIKHRPDASTGLRRWGGDENPTSRIVTKRGRLIDVSVVLDLSECYPLFESWGLSSIPPNIYSGDESNGSGPKLTLNGQNDEVRLCGVHIELERHLTSQSVFSHPHYGELAFTYNVEESEDLFKTSGNVIDCSKVFNFYIRAPMESPFYHDKIYNKVSWEGGDFLRCIVGNYILLKLTVMDNSGRRVKAIKPLMWIPRHLRGLSLKKWETGIQAKDYVEIKRGGGWCGFNPGLDKKIGLWGVNKTLLDEI